MKPLRKFFSYEIIWRLFISLQSIGIFILIYLHTTSNIYKQLSKAVWCYILLFIGPFYLAKIIDWILSSSDQRNSSNNNSKNRERNRFSLSVNRIEKDIIERWTIENEINETTWREYGNEYSKHKKLTHYIFTTWSAYNKIDECQKLINEYDQKYGENAFLKLICNTILSHEKVPSNRHAEIWSEINSMLHIYQGIIK